MFVVNISQTISFLVSPLFLQLRSSLKRFAPYFLERIKVGICNVNAVHIEYMKPVILYLDVLHLVDVSAEKISLKNEIIIKGMKSESRLLNNATALKMQDN